LNAYLLRIGGCGKGSTAHWIEQLKAPGAIHRIEAVHTWQFRKMKALRIVPALIEALKDENVYLRQGAARALRFSAAEAKSATLAIRMALHDREPGVCRAAAFAMSRNDRQSASPLNPAEREDNNHGAGHLQQQRLPHQFPGSDAIHGSEPCLVHQPQASCRVLSTTCKQLGMRPNRAWHSSRRHQAHWKSVSHQEGQDIDPPPLRVLVLHALPLAGLDPAVLDRQRRCKAAPVELIQPRAAGLRLLLFLKFFS
jgi:hypothetical protein